MKNNRPIILMCCICMTLIPVRSFAESLTEFTEYSALVVALTFFGDYTPANEAFLIKGSWKLYLLQQDRLNKKKVGQVIINGSYPTSFVLSGSAALATFDFVDTTTELLADGPEVDEVFWEWDSNPADGLLSWSPLGISTDPSDNFAISFNMLSPYPLEPILRATPYFEGEPVSILGVNDENIAVGIGVAIAVPELSTFALMIGVFVVGFGFAIRRWMTRS